MGANKMNEIINEIKSRKIPTSELSLLIGLEAIERLVKKDGLSQENMVNDVILFIQETLNEYKAIIEADD